ncbi:hypothetical protein JCM3770_007255 [Rhodotorula araucariae]
MESSRQQAPLQPPTQAAPAQAAASAASPPSAASSASNGGAPQQQAPPQRPYLPGPSMSSAEKSLFPNSIPVRQLPGIHSFSAAPSAGTASPPLPGPARTTSGGLDQQQQQHRFAAQTATGPSCPSLPSSDHAGARRRRLTCLPPAAALPYSSLSNLPSRPSAAAGSPAANPQLAAPGVKPAPTPPVLPAISSPALAATVPAPAPSRSPYSATGNGAPVPAASAAQQQPSPNPAGPAPSSTNAPVSRSNPMSVSAMLSNPPRAQPVSAYSPLSAASNGATPAPPTPQPPVLPPSSRPNAAGEQPKATPVTTAPPRTQPGATLPAYASSLVAPAPAATAAAKPAEQVQPQPQPQSQPQGAAAAAAAARSSYPPLPSAFARENPYSPAAPSPAPSAGAATPQQQQQQQREAAAAALKSSLFPNLGSYRPTAGAPPQQQSPRQPAGAGAGTPYQWQAQAAQQAQQAQQQQQQAQAQRFGQAATQALAGKQARPPATSSNSAPTLGAAARSGQPHEASPSVKTPVQTQTQAYTRGTAAQPSARQEPQQLAQGAAGRFPSASAAPAAAADAYTTHARGPQLGANGQVASTAMPQGQVQGSGGAGSAQAGLKRRRSDAAEQQQQQQQQVQPPPFQRVKSGASGLASPPATPSAACATPLFTYAECRKAMVHPPVVDVLNEAVDTWVGKHALPGEERKFLGRVTYDALTPPAKLLDGELLVDNVGGFVEVVVPTSWILGPQSHSAAAASLSAVDVRSSCSVAPVDPHPVALSFGPPAAYSGEPLPLTSTTTPLVLPAHLADLPAVRKRAVWGTDVYTDDSDVLLVLLHSGWLRVTRRERRLRAGEKGAGADAIRRARTLGEERIDVLSGNGDGADEVPVALLVRLGVVPALVRYEGIERQGVRSRSWGNGHDGVSLRVEDVQPLDSIPGLRAPRARKPRAATCAHQLAALHRAAYPSAHAAAANGAHAHAPAHAHSDAHALLPPPPPRRYRFGGAAGGEGVLITDTFVLDLREGRGRFVGLEGDADGDAEELRRFSGGESDAVPMEVEAA